MKPKVSFGYRLPPVPAGLPAGSDEPMNGIDLLHLKPRRSFRYLIGIVLLCVGGSALAPSAEAQSVTRTRFTPTVVPETQTDPVRFEATVSGSPSSVVFNYNNVDRPMFDNGTNGDLVAGDGRWTILFTPAEILSKNTAARVFRPFIGQCKPAGGGAFNVVAEVWTSAIGLPGGRAIDAGGQETDYIANYVATSSQLQNFDQRVWAQRFYATHGDKYDFLNFVLVAGPVGNRFHFATKNAVQGIGLSIFDNTSQYGSAGKLQGISTFPISSFFDGADQGFSHEIGHQWINFLAGTPFASGTPHWPLGNIAINVMGFSIGGPGGQGGTYSFTFSPNGSGGYVVGNSNQLNLTTFNSMELYLMGLIPPSEVETFFVLKNQAQNVTAGQTLQPSEITLVTVNDIIAARGPRVPDSTQAQRNFRSATIVVAEQLLDAHAMALYDYFARRSEQKQQLSFASGLATGTSNPWYLATGGRSVMVSEIADPTPTYQPVVLTAAQIAEIKVWTVGGRSYVYVKPQFPDAGYRVVDWGQVGRSGNDFTVDASVEKFTGPSIKAVVTTAQIYDLGPLANGTYNFNFKTSGTLAKTLQFTISSTVPPPNPIDNAREFVKQQYRDFLNREADQAGEDFWTDNITKCSDPARRPVSQTEAQCTLRQRETTSGAFFLSPEFQYTGYYVLRMYTGALGRGPKLSEFTPDAQFVGAGIIVNSQLSAAKINQNKADFAQQFVNCTDPAKYRCAEFKMIYDGLNNQQYVDKLFLTTGVNASASDRAALVNGLNANPATETRASVLQKVVDGIVVIAEGNQQFTTSYGQAFYNSEFNRAFVQLEYFGYMKRDPDDAGYAFWLGKLNQFGGNFVNAEMVLAFISSPEYRARFGQP